MNHGTGVAVPLRRAKTGRPGRCPRAGRPPTEIADDAGEVIAVDLTDPAVLDLPIGCWTLAL